MYILKTFCFSGLDLDDMEPMFYPFDDPTYDQRTIKIFLERTYGFMICDHVRDFIGGRQIPDQIEEAMDKSRRFICLLSR